MAGVIENGTSTLLGKLPPDNVYKSYTVETLAELRRVKVDTLISETAGLVPPHPPGTKLLHVPEVSVIDHERQSGEGQSAKLPESAVFTLAIEDFN